MSTLSQPFLTPEQYLAIEREADHKSEYFAGEMFAMSGASEPHNVISVNATRELSLQLRGRPCRVYANDMRVKVDVTGLYTYPDVGAVCGERRFDDTHQDTLVNPTLIVEVLSPSTELYDRGRKFDHYSRIESLTDYLLIAQDRPRVEHYARKGDQQWLLSVFEDLQATVPLVSLGCVLEMALLYENVDFVPNETET